MKIERKSIETAFLNGNLTHSNQMRNNGGAFFSIVFRLSFVNSERKNVSFFLLFSRHGRRNRRRYCHMNRIERREESRKKCHRPIYL